VRHAYLYYRIDPAQETDATVRIDALLDAMAHHCTQPPRRLTRCGDPATWMEIYEGISDFAAFTHALGTATHRFGCATFTRGERHLECFSPADHATLSS
jgi:hypothetical protein